ncbi:MAG: DUF2889 domain-containing protein [Alphaproteobacteria bacterium]|nr:DUF2889 domain-containing protein [Alphaproteobacteria bacterium]
MSHLSVLETLPPVRGPMGHAPLRRLHSVRRTTSIDVTWPDGRDGAMHFDSRGRDIRTGAAAEDVTVVQADSYTASIGRDRALLTLEVSPGRAFAATLIGCRGGGHLRAALKKALPEDAARSTPLYLLLDDVSGASLIANWAWSRWVDFNAHPPAHMREMPSMEGVCTGFRPGSSSLNGDGTTRFSDRSQDVTLLPHPDDPAGWHEMPFTTEVTLRRSRRIDVWVDGLVHIDAMFQDSATKPQGGRAAIHEYHLTATADPQSGRILSVEATPRVLPYVECPGAVLNIHRVKAMRLEALRDEVPVLLAKTEGCTHLNDALRALTCVPAMLEELGA